MDSKIAIRVHSEGNKKKFFPNTNQKLTHKRVLVFDTETSADKFQNLKIGSFIIAEGKKRICMGMFYSPSAISKFEKEILESYCYENKIELYTREEFVINVFYPEILNIETLCVGFNLPFDISRLAIYFSEGRIAHRDWFSMKLTEQTMYPRIKIKHIDSTKSFIQFGSNKFTNKKRFKGYFLDLKTLASTFADKKSITLKQAGESFNCDIKKIDVGGHGKIDEDYLKYNLQDTEATFSLYLSLCERYKEYGIPIPIHKIYSSASLGKYALSSLGILPLSQINSEINANLKGKLMTGYFGGRCETKLRKEPTFVTVLDFLSMYPSLSINMGLWDFIIAKEIKTCDATKEVKVLLNGLKLENLRKKEIWKTLNILVELRPDEDILPTRSNYLENSSIFNVGLNYLSTKDSLFYALPDVIASFLLTGEVPNIISAIKFIPIGKQDTLKKAKILGIDIDPREDNFIKKLIEKRYEIKKQRNNFIEGTQEYLNLDDQQRALKILANSSTYGIFIEMNQQDKESKFQIYGANSFWVKQKREEAGRFFNPLIAVMQIAGARLLLTMAEVYLIQSKATHYYMDTDSCFVPPVLAEKLRDLFAPLNPYSFESDFFEIEKGKENLLFYSISSKRYVLYKIEDNKVSIIDHKLHGLGHILNPYGQTEKWQKQIWQDILDLHYGTITRDEIVNKYSQFYCISKLSVSTPRLHQRFKKYNGSKPLSEQIKPFNFLLIGQGSNKKIKPIAPFSKNPQEAVFGEFLDYNSCEVLRGEEHWRPLSEIILNFLDHPESKFENGKEVGIMKRRHLKNGTITFIGKETKNIDTQTLERTPAEVYFDEEEMKKKILEMTPEEAREKGVSRDGLWRIKQKFKKGDINWKSKNVKKLLS